jgi:hypothetical protein
MKFIAALYSTAQGSDTRDDEFTEIAGIIKTKKAEGFNTYVLQLC